MSAEAETYAAIALLAALTLAMRLSGPALMARAPLTGRVRRFLDGMASAVLAALVATIAAQGGLRELAAAGVAGLAMLGAGNASVAMLAGVVVAAAWTAFL
jgi:uncharacterized membrane protein